MDCSHVEIKDTTDVDTRIRHKILCPNYDENIAPASDRVDVNISFKLVSFDFVSFPAFFEYFFIEFHFYKHEDDATLTTESYISQTWVDKRLAWNPSDFNGVGKTFAQVDELWIPDMTIYNSQVFYDFPASQV